MSWLLYMMGKGETRINFALDAVASLHLLCAHPLVASLLGCRMLQRNYSLLTAVLLLIHCYVPFLLACLFIILCAAFGALRTNPYCKTNQSRVIRRQFLHQKTSISHVAIFVFFLSHHFPQVYVPSSPSCGLSVICVRL